MSILSTSPGRMNTDCGSREKVTRVGSLSLSSSLAVKLKQNVSSLGEKK